MMSSHQQPEIIEKYFSSINPIASKIHHDINETKSSYEHIWNELNDTEQIDIINETLIKPEIALRYFDSFTTPTGSSTIVAAATIPATTIAASSNDSDSSPVYRYDGKHLKTYSNQKTAQKFINDDVIGVFRDEHSAPFSSKTKSQINLNLFHSSPANQAIAQNQSTTTTVGAAAATTAAVLKTTSTFVGDVMPSTTAKHQQPIQKSQLKIIAEATSSILPTLVKQITTNNTATANNKKYERFYNDEKRRSAATDQLQIAGDDDDNFINKFICKNNLIYNKTTNDSSQLVIVASNEYDRDDDDDRDYEKKILVKDISYIGGDVGNLDSTLSLHSEEDDDKHVYEDSKLLLETSADDLRKGFDFLNNW